MPIFLAVAAALAFLFLGPLLDPLAPLVKAIPAAVLSSLVWRSGRSGERRLAALGLLVSALADLAIEFSFLSGLIAFLVAHLFYIGAFTRLCPQAGLARFLPVAVWAAAALPVLVSRAGDLRLPVLIYGAVIFVMIWRAAVGVSVIGWNPGTIGLMGAVLFGISDTLLGYSRFVTPVPGSRLLVMGTYWAGQAFIAISFLRTK